MGPDLDTISELLEDFKTQLRQENKSKGTIDVYGRDVGYFVTFLQQQVPPIEPTSAALTRENISAYIIDTLNRTNQRKFNSALYKQFEIDNRVAATQGPRSDGMCTLVVNIKDGGIRLDTLSQKIDPCQILTDFGNAVVPHLPPGS